MKETFNGEFAYRFGQQNEWEIVLANTMALREKAFKLAYDTYKSKGYSIKSDGLWLTIYSLHPDTVIFLALRSEQTVGTVSVIPDSVLGLPSDLLFPEHLAALRKIGRRICEAFSLVVADRPPNGFLELPMHLFRLVYLSAVYLMDGTEVTSSFMEHHKEFYTRFLLFDEISADSRISPRTGQKVRYGRINLETMKERYKKIFGHLSGRRNLHRWFFENELEKDMIKWLKENRKCVSKEELMYFGYERSNILSEAESATVNTLMSLFEHKK